jgi:hypothetical protein
MNQAAEIVLKIPRKGQRETGYEKAIGCFYGNITGFSLYLYSSL